MTDDHGLAGSGLQVTVVDACLRHGAGGSPTAVVTDAAFGDDQRRTLPGLVGTSHVVFVQRGVAEGEISLRFFTSAGELPACGHGTVAALALAAQRGITRQLRVRTPERVLDGRVTSTERGVHASFEPGTIELSTPALADVLPVLHALGSTSNPAAVRQAAVPRRRLLVPVPDAATLAEIRPDFAALRVACDRLGLLGCYVYSPPSADGRLAARMFAPSIGVDEDIANANSTACLCAYLAEQGYQTIAVDMGDALATQATITASADEGPAGRRVQVGGAAVVARTLRL